MSGLNISGIHHITAIAGDPQKNVNFYSGILGLRFIKKTINFDAPDTYHLYFGDRTGSPGSVLTFFPWGEGAWRGRAGTGQVTVISLAVPTASIGSWLERLQLADISVQGPVRRFDEEVITFRDSDGIQLELVGTGSSSPALWKNGHIPAEEAVRGFYGATLAVTNSERTATLLTNSLGFEYLASEGNRHRYINREGQIGHVVDVLELPAGNEGRMGVGAIHHIAWRTPDDSTQIKKQRELEVDGYQVTPVVDRKYFSSIYFREPEKILFEVATDTPGFLIDENENHLGEELKLPEWYESRRNEIEAGLPRIDVPQSSTIVQPGT